MAAAISNMQIELLVKQKVHEVATNMLQMAFQPTLTMSLTSSANASESSLLKLLSRQEDYSKSEWRGCIGGYQVNMQHNASAADLKVVLVDMQAVY